VNFQCTVIEDCCADHDAEVYRVLTTTVFPRRASAVTVDERTALLQGNPARTPE
jgi:hypothetical protein